MDYLKMIEFLSQELIRKDDAVNSLRNDVDYQKSIVDRLTKLNDKHLADIIAKEDAVGDAEANLHWVEDELNKMTQLKDKYLGDLNIWKDELDSCCNQLRLYKDELRLHKDELKEMTIEKDHWKAEALEYRNEREPEWWDEEEKYKAEIKVLNKELNRMRIATEEHWATDFAYHHLKKEYDSIKDYYEERIAKLQVEINHFKNNK